MRKKNWHKFPLLFSIYIAQQVPMSFFSTVIPVLMRQQNYSLESIGLLQLVKLTWIAKFLWAPLVDRTTVDLRHYKRWIFISELIYAALILSIGFLDLKVDFMLIIFLLVPAFLASATQDIATDAFAIKILKTGERSLGNSMQSAGSFGGTLIGTGVLMIMYYYFGWTILLVCLAVFVLIPLIPLLFYRNGADISPVRKKSVTMADLYRFFKIPGIFKRILILVFYYSGIIGIMTMLKPFLVDHGYSAKDIGIMSGIIGSTMAMLAALAAGWIIKRTGRRRSMFAFAFTGLATAIYFRYLSSVEVSTISVYTGIILIWVSYAFATVIIYTTAMDIVRKGREGTDFTLQIVITHLSSLIMAVLSGKIAGSFGYSGLYTVEIFLGIATIVLLFIVYPKKLKLNADTQIDR